MAFEVQFTAIGTDNWAHYGPDGQTWETGKEAAAEKERAEANYGDRFKYRVRPVAVAEVDDATWRERERSKLYHGDYVLVPWHHEYWNDALRLEHFCHMSISQPGKVAFTETPEKGRQDRQTRMTPGRYLQRYFADVLSPQEIENWAAKVSVEAGSCELHFTQDADEIEEVYVNGPGSCMSYDTSEYSSHCHPTRVYAGPDLALAYVGTLEAPSGRALVWPEQKIYSNQYGDCSRMRLLLERAGYKRGGLEGARVRLIWNGDDDGNEVVMPYTDSCDRARIVGAFVVLGDGPIYTQNTSGTSSIVPTVMCDRCESDTPEDDVTHIEDTDENWCAFCRSNSATYCDYLNAYLSSDATWTEVCFLNWNNRVASRAVSDLAIENGCYDGLNWHEPSETYLDAELLALVEALEAIATLSAALPSPGPDSPLERAWIAYVQDELALAIAA